LGVVAALALAGASAGGATRACSGVAAPGRSTLRVSTPDGVRRALIQVPARAGRAAPLVLAFHGTGGTGPFMAGYSGLGRVAERAGFVVAYPSAQEASESWSLAEDDLGRDDLVLTDAVIDRLVSAGCVDPARVYAVGVSNGGGFAMRLGCEQSDRIAAVVAVAGGYGSLPPCRPDRPVSVLEIHGTADPVVPYRGKPPAGAGAVLPLMRAWARDDGCRAVPRRAVVAPRVTRLDWDDCSAGAAVAHLRIAGGTHQWPGATPPDPGPPSTIAAADVAWRFLRDHRLAPLAR
jgi:polyhydroxybutyrate depolymerase